VVDSDEDVVAYAVAYAAELCEHCSPSSMAAIKQQVWSDLNGTLPEAAKRADQLTEQAVGAADFAESLKSWRLGRPPQFAPLATSATSSGAEAAAPAEASGPRTGSEPG
jgi:enoyl-CoA hydratase/carnithine racemase